MAMLKNKINTCSYLENICTTCRKNASVYALVQKSLSYSIMMEVVAMVFRVFCWVMSIFYIYILIHLNTKVT